MNKVNRTNTRQKRDISEIYTEDTVGILKTIADDGRNPFSQDSALKNILTGVNVDVDEARAKGEKILSVMAGKPEGTYSFKRKKQSITLVSGKTVKRSMWTHSFCFGS